MPELGNIACAPCGASLQGIALDAACPACARSVSDTLNIAVIDPATLTIAGDALCIGCGYNLRTMHV